MPECTLADLNKVHECEAVIGYKFKDPSLLFTALQPDHALCDIRPKTCRYHGESKKNLALVGMKVVDLLLADRWYRSQETSHGTSVPCLAEAQSDLLMILLRCSCIG